jgi:radical SAM superfamily enzyme YgiQ (UPF0313 family)
MKLMLVAPSWCQSLGAFRSVAKSVSSFPPVNLAVVAGIAERAGWEVKILDQEVEKRGDSGVLYDIGCFDPDLVGLTATSPFFHRARELGTRIKKSFDCPVLLGGPHASIVRGEALEPWVDHLFIGEVENSLPAFLSEASSGRVPSGIPGVLQRDFPYIGDSCPPANLDSSPRPSRELLRNDRYFMGTPQGSKRYTSVLMSRGCPFRCVFCANDLYGKRVRRRSVGSVIEELWECTEKYGIEHVYFLDDCLTLNRPFILDLCTAIHEHGLEFTFEGSTRANLWDEEIAGELKAAGLVRISFGLETADEEVRRTIKKQVPLESYVEANRTNRKLGIETINSVMLGLPGENPDSIKKTISFLNRNRIQHATYSIATPYPGTELLSMAKAGTNGLSLVEEDLSKYQRYGSSVMQVGDLSPEDLKKLQRRGLLSIYLRWWRWLPTVRRHGLKALLKVVGRLFFGWALAPWERNA